VGVSFAVVMALGDQVGYFTLLTGPSMLPSIKEVGDLAFVDVWTVKREGVRRGDVVICRKPESPERERVCKRVTGIPGDTVIYFNRYSAYPVVSEVPTGHVWLSGDNPDQSNDSRKYGPVGVGLVLGKVISIKSMPRAGAGIDADDVAGEKGKEKETEGGGVSVNGNNIISSSSSSSSCKKGGLHGTQGDPGSGRGSLFGGLMGGFDLNNVNAGLPDRIRVTDDTCLVHDNGVTRWDRTNIIDPPKRSFNADSTIFSLFEPLKVLGRLLSLPPSLERWRTGRDVVTGKPASLPTSLPGGGGGSGRGETPGAPSDGFDWVTRFRVGSSFKPLFEEIQARRLETQTLAVWQEELRLMSIATGEAAAAPADADNKDGASNGMPAPEYESEPEGGDVAKAKAKAKGAEDTETKGWDRGSGAEEGGSGGLFGAAAREAQAAMHRIMPHLTTEQRRVALMLMHDRRDLLRHMDYTPMDVVVVLPGHGPTAVGKRW